MASPAAPTSSDEAQNLQSDQSEAETDITIVFDGLKTCFEQEYTNSEIDEGSDIDQEIEADMFDNIEFGFRLAEMTKREEEDPDWIPERLQRKAQKRAANQRGESYTGSE